MRRILWIAMAVAVCGTGLASAQDGIDGVWLGTYTSKYSPAPTHEVLIFATAGGEVVGAYLSANQAAGTLVGHGSAGSYAFGVTEPVKGCPPSSGTLLVTMSGGALSYSFSARSCQGTDFGKGTAQRATSSEELLAALKITTPAPVSGLWNGVYTSNFSPNPTHEKIFLADFGSATSGIYVSESGGVGLLTGQTPSNPFALAVDAPSPPCPGRGIFEGAVEGPEMPYAFRAIDCESHIDIGRGQAERVP